jgi:hypothetical protein
MPKRYLPARRLAEMNHARTGLGENLSGATAGSKAACRASKKLKVFRNSTLERRIIIRYSPAEMGILQEHGEFRAHRTDRHRRRRVNAQTRCVIQQQGAEAEL